MTRGKKPYCNPIICPWDGFRAEFFGNIVIRGGEKSLVKVFLNIELQCGCGWVGGYHPAGRFGVTGTTEAGVSASGKIYAKQSLYSMT